MASRVRVLSLFAAVAYLASTGLHAQAQPYSGEFLPAIRHAASAIPGESPSAVRVVSLNPFRIPISYMVDSASNDTVNAAYPVFQIRFPHGWIIVDAAMDREFEPSSKTWSDATYQQIQVALRDARLVVVTHEHHDHVAGVIRSPYLSRIQEHTLLNRSQLQSLLERPNNPLIRIDSLTAARYLEIDYKSLLPIAPGVVLIKAAGHTPGSQMVYVHLSSGREIVLAGDVAWHMSGIDTQQQKPTASTQEFGGEQREPIAQQLRWLKQIAGPRTFVIVAHDEDRIKGLTGHGVLLSGFDFTNP
jgi:glyoxylase-like metal-dependent hydrolase (beta-lactamase superfamily II)